MAVLIDPGNRRARIETTSQIGWFNLAEPALRRSVETEGAAGGERRKPASGLGATIAPRRKPDGLACELRRRVSTIGQSDWLDNDDSGTYTITGLMPGLEGRQPEYQIKHFSEEFERVAFENELTTGESEHGQR